MAKQGLARNGITCFYRFFNSGLSKMLKGRALLVTWLCFIPITAWAQAEISDPRVTNIKNWIESTIKELGPDRVGAVLIFGIIGIIVFARLLQAILSWLWRINEILSSLNDISSKLNKLSELNMNTKTSGQVPSGVALDDRVVLVPPLPEEFDRPLWIATLTAVGGTPKWIAKPGEWVNYGQPLCSFTIHYGALPGFLRIFGTLSKHELIIRSPIHGLVLSEGNAFSDKVDWHNPTSYGQLSR